jgi:putative FmdB family regulatory protein
MRIAPPLTVTDAEIDLGLELLDADPFGGHVPRPRRLAGAVAGEYISLGGLEAGQQLSSGRATAGRTTMPHYDFYCQRCKKEVTLTLSIGARERGDYKCPGCGGKKLEPLMGTFFSKTSRKA